MEAEEHPTKEIIKEYLSRSEEKEGDLAIYEHMKTCPACRQLEEQLNKEVWAEFKNKISPEGF